MPEFNLPIDEGERQIVILALAQLAKRRPGWIECVREIALRISDPQMYDSFFEMAPDGTGDFDDA
jgi:hypothetical protein